MRRTLVPWRFDEALTELEDVVGRYGIDEVIAKIDTEEFSRGHVTLDDARSYASSLNKLRDRLEARGVVYSLNPWITVGHLDRGRDDRERFPAMAFMVGHDGVESRHCACPLSQAWRRHVAGLWEIYAATRPRVMWVEDDLRTFNHLPVAFGCFCSLHMERFSHRVSEKVSREELVSAILAPGPPHPWRTEYLRMQEEVTRETAELLRDAVHAASPESVLGLMSSGPRMHAIEGRRWERLARTFTPMGRPVSRPPLGSYDETSLRELYYTQDSIKLTHACLPAETEELTEVENVPFTRYSKSTRFTALQIWMSIACGCRGVTLNLFDHVGTPMEATPEFGEMLAMQKPALRKLAEAVAETSAFRGVSVCFREDESEHRRVPPGRGYESLEADGFAAVRFLEGLGVSSRYEDAPIRFLSGQTARALDNEAIDRYLREGILLDATAAHVLFERGFGASLGLEAIDPPRPRDELGPLAAERIDLHSDHALLGRMVTATVPSLLGTGKLGVLHPAPGAETATTFVDAFHSERMPGCIRFENAFGGRVVVLAHDLATCVGPAMFHPTRRGLLHDLLRWLNPSGVCHIEPDGGYPLLLAREGDTHTLLTIFNLTLDIWPSCCIELGDRRNVASIEELDGDTWRAAKDVSFKHRGSNVWRITDQRPCSYERPRVLNITWK